VKTITLVIVMSLLASACSMPTLRTEMSFANKLAQEDLWQEACYRWEKQLAENPDSPAVLNNLAVAMEQLGRRDEAEKYYRKAIELAPKNTMIQRNFNRFMNPDSDKKEKADEKPQSPHREAGPGR